MPRYRDALPQLTDALFLTDAGLETDLIFNKGIEIREFAAHTLLPSDVGCAVLADYFRDFIKLARKHRIGFIFDAQTWKTHVHWSQDLKETEAELRQANHDAVKFIEDIRAELDEGQEPIVLNAAIGPIGDAYKPEAPITVEDAQAYHAKQLGWLAETNVDMVSALTHTQSDEAAGFALAAEKLGLPCVISFTVETDGCLPTGQPLSDAINRVDEVTCGSPAYYMVNCAHPEHFQDILTRDKWARRIRGIRCNASRLSHAELDAC
jgi:S-methylmethionine-dependent homocysteine/selenocysteine methylase